MKKLSDNILCWCGNGGNGVNPFEAIGLQSLYNLSEKMSDSK